MKFGQTQLADRDRTRGNVEAELCAVQIACRAEK
jgi:hypothetical protein